VASNLARAQLPGNVLLPAHDTGLPRDSVANVTQLYTVDKELFEEPIGFVGSRALRRIVSGINGLLEPTELPDPEG
jgi:mRNA interferase MazF